MARFELLLPKMGESVAEATLVKWAKQPGDSIQIDDTVVEIATDKVDSEVPSPVKGKLVEQLCKENDVIQVGDIIGIIETDDIDEAEAQDETHESVVDNNISQVPDKEPVSELNKLRAELPYFGEKETSDSKPDNFKFFSPLVKSIAAENGISFDELNTINGSGADGRITKQDILDYVKDHRSSQESEKPVEKSAEPIKSSSVDQPQAGRSSEPAKPVISSVSGGDEIIEMDRMRKLIADHMVMSVQTSPHVTSFVEADVTNIVKWREKNRSNFEKREGEKITYTPIFIEAVAKAIKDLPMVNVSVNGTQIIKKRDINIGMATLLPSGNLIVPVIKNADQLNLVGLTKSVNDFANRARTNKLLPDEVKDGTFTITNIGSFGNIMGTPIINQPQVAILAVGVIQKKPAVIETEFGDVIAIRHKMYLSLSYDHRVVDGSLGGMFVKKVADYLEAWDINREL